MSDWVRAHLTTGGFGPLVHTENRYHQISIHKKKIDCSSELGARHVLVASWVVIFSPETHHHDWTLPTACHFASRGRGVSNTSIGRGAIEEKAVPMDDLKSAKLVSGEESASGGLSGSSVEILGVKYGARLGDLESSGGFRSSIDGFAVDPNGEWIFGVDWEEDAEFVRR